MFTCIRAWHDAVSKDSMSEDEHPKTRIHLETDLPIPLDSALSYCMNLNQLTSLRNTSGVFGECPVVFGDLITQTLRSLRL